MKSKAEDMVWTLVLIAIMTLAILSLTGCATDQATNNARSVTVVCVICVGDVNDENDNNSEP